MTDNEAEDVRRPEGASDCIFWFFENVSYGHRDEIPTEYLEECIQSSELNVKCCHVVMSAMYCADGKTDDPHILATAANQHRSIGMTNLHYFNLWCVLELASRMKMIDFPLPDVLVKDMARDKSLFESKPISTWRALAKLIITEIKKRKGKS